MVWRISAGVSSFDSSLLATVTRRCGGLARS
jgi:coproporphyrinogen III oxidase-like Fe-S oxidoreductase